MATLHLDLRKHMPKIAKLAIGREPYGVGEGDPDLDLSAFRSLIWPQRTAIAAALRAEVEKRTKRKLTIRLASDGFVRKYVEGERYLGHDVAVCVLCDYYDTLDGEVGGPLPGDMFVFAVRGEPSAYFPLELLL
jgi:hypothetical protein